MAEIDKSSKSGFLDEEPGQHSSTRLIIMIVVCNGVLLADAFAFAGIWKHLHPVIINDVIQASETLTSVAQAFAMVIVSVVFPAAAWKVSQKIVENKQP